MKKQFPDIILSVLLALLFILLQAVVAVFVKVVFGSQGLMLILGVTVPALVIVLLAASINGTSLKETIHWGAVRGRRVLPIVLMTLSAAVLSSEMENIIADYVLSPETYSKYVEDLSRLFVMDNRADLLLGLVSLTIFGPLMEEALFRGVIYRGIAKNRGKPIAVVTSSILFMLVHVNPAQFPAALALGVLYSAMIARGYSVTDTFFSHSLFNTISAFFFYNIVEFPGMSVNKGAEVVHIPLYLILLALATFTASLLLVFRRFDGRDV
ncbi:MAG: CPBP family intramembrane metalloprotease [Deltaproteobacteria bacterium]|uniref:CPBP family intramembrane metalloprotease n=1 Tax=Candidatus Zymogenus saltonus TaxID=2844893 RepID=A0A9D8KG21_9DELT|nr:CPBP family intramembrane metalloprotease [Candidatus Zymogenus saltonus]